MSNYIDNKLINNLIYKIIDNELTYINIDINIDYKLSSFIINNNCFNLFEYNNFQYIDKRVINLNLLNSLIKTLKSSLKINSSLKELKVNFTFLYSSNYIKNIQLVIYSFINLFSILTYKRFSKVKLLINTIFNNDINILASKLNQAIDNIILHNNNLQVLDLSNNSIEYIYYILTKLNKHNLKELKLSNYIQSISIDEINGIKILLDFINNNNIKIDTLNLSDNIIDDLSILNSFILKNKYIHNLILDYNNIDYINNTFIDNLKSNNIQYISLKNNLFEDDQTSIKYFNTLIEFK